MKRQLRLLFYRQLLINNIINNLKHNTMKKSYITPRIDIISVRVERGFSGSCMTTLYLSSNEQVSSNGGIRYGSGEPWDNGSNVEGLGDAGTIFF